MLLVTMFWTAFFTAGKLRTGAMEMSPSMPCFHSSAPTGLSFSENTRASIQHAGWAQRQKTWLVLTSLDIHSSYVPILLNSLYRIIFHVALSLQVDIHTVRINKAGMTCRE